LSGFERGQIIVACYPVASRTKTATLSGVLRVAVSKVCWHTQSWEDNFSKEEQWTKINIDRKRSAYTQDCFEKITELLQDR
jgi:hypothetical protein